MGFFDKLLASSDKEFEKQSLSGSEQRLADQAEQDAVESAERYAEMVKPMATLLYFDGISKMTPQEVVTVFADNDRGRVEITSCSTKRSVFIAYSQLCAAGIVNDVEIIGTDKSVIGRAAVGGLILGPVGAIVGGISGTGEKSRAITKYYYVINYHPASAPEEIAVVKFAIPGMLDGIYNLNTSIQLAIPSGDTEEYL